MSRLGNKIMALGVLGGLALAGFLMNSKPAAAGDGGPTVTIGGPLPVPVTGTATVSGTIAATQSGAWSVGISGTPNVNIASLPAVQLSGNTTVNVANPSAAPLFVVNLSDPGRAPYQSTQLLGCNGNQCSASFPGAQNGHRLVVEHITGGVSFAGATTAFVQLQGVPNGPLMAFAVPVQDQGSQFDQQVLAYFDSGNQPFVTIFAKSAAINGATLTVSGHIVDCTIASCAPIAQ